MKLFGFVVVFVLTLLVGNGLRNRDLLLKQDQQTFIAHNLQKLQQEMDNGGRCETNPGWPENGSYSCVYPKNVQKAIDILMAENLARRR